MKEEEQIQKKLKNKKIERDKTNNMFSKPLASYNQGWVDALNWVLGD